MTDKLIEIQSLTASERLDLIEELWDSLNATPQAILLTEEQRRVLDLRDAELEEDIQRGRPLGIPWPEVLRQLRTPR